MTERKNLWDRDIFQPTEKSEPDINPEDSLLNEEIEEEVAAINSLDKQIEEEKNHRHHNTQKMQEEINLLQKSLEDSRDKLIRASADIENIRRRAQMDIEKAHKYSLEQLVKSLLPVIDSMEKALEIATEADRAHLEGVELTLKMFIDAFEKFGVKPINPLYEPFDPIMHEAITAQPNSEVDTNTVLEVFQKGYTLNGRLIRPAKVIVSTMPGGNS